MTRWDGGQASIEVLALVPAAVLVLIAALQVAAMLAGVSSAQDDARTRALGAGGASGATAVVTGTATVPVMGVLGWRRDAVRVHASVRLP